MSHNIRIPSWDEMGFDVFHNDGYLLHRKNVEVPFGFMPEGTHEDEITSHLAGIHIRDLNKTITAKDARIKELEAQLAEYKVKEAEEFASIEAYLNYDNYQRSLDDSDAELEAYDNLMYGESVAIDQLAELTAPKPVEIFEPELLTGSFSSFYGQTVYPFGIVNVAHFYYDGGYEQVIVLPAAWEENKEALEASVGKEITIKATWQDDELEFIFDSIVAEDK